MKALVMALFLATTALSYALGEIISPAIADPHLIWVWGGPAIALAVQTVIFWFTYVLGVLDHEYHMREADISLQVQGSQQRRVHDV